MAKVTVVQTGSPIRRTQDQRATLKGLGLNLDSVAIVGNGVIAIVTKPTATSSRSWCTSTASPPP